MGQVPVKGYVCEGNAEGAKTYGVTDGDITLIQIQFPNGKLSEIKELSWSIERWKGQMGAEQTATLEPIPEELIEEIDSYRGT